MYTQEKQESEKYLRDKNSEISVLDGHVKDLKGSVVNRVITSFMEGHLKYTYSPFKMNLLTIDFNSLRDWKLFFILHNNLRNLHFLFLINLYFRKQLVIMVLCLEEQSH